MAKSSRRPQSATRRLVQLVVTTSVIFASTVAVTFAYVLQLPDEYTGRSIVLFGSRLTPNGGLAGATSVEASAAGYVAFISAPSTLTSVADAIGADRDQLRDGLSVTQLPATSTVEIAYTNVDAQNAAVGANALAETVAQRTLTDPVIYAEVLAEAAVPVNPSGPGRLLRVLAGAFLGALAAAAVGAAVWAAPDALRRRTVPRSPSHVSREDEEVPDEENHASRTV